MADLMQSPPDIASVTWIGGFPIADSSADALAARINRKLADRTPTELHFANTNFILGCRHLRDALCAMECIIVNDGIGMDLARRGLYGRPFRANLNGTDFTPRLLAQLEQPARLFLLGSAPDVVRKAADAWSALPHIEIVGAVDGFDGSKDDRLLLDRLAHASPDILLVALGNPRQEAWIVAHRGKHPASLVIGVGALFDFVSGRTPRAPPLVQRMRLEWLHRLALEPRRLAKRYTVDIARFFVHCFRMRRVIGVVERR